MGAGSSAADISSANALEYFFRELQVGILRGVSSVITSGSPNPSDSWVICYISEGGTSIASAILILYSDYITTETPLTWSGHYAITGAERVVTACRSTVAIRLQTIVNVDISQVP